MPITSSPSITRTSGSASQAQEMPAPLPIAKTRTTQNSRAEDTITVRTELTTISSRGKVTELIRSRRMTTLTSPLPVPEAKKVQSTMPIST